MNKNVNIIGVTGSNGKTTTVTLIYNIMKEAGLPVYLGGNIGTPLCNFVQDIKENEYLVMEISDHQLCDMYEFKTDVSVLTNIYDVHTDFHDSHEKYVMTKKKIFNNHTKNEIAIINYDNKEAVDISADIHSTKYYFSKDIQHNVYLKENAIYYGDEMVIQCKDIKLKGTHNYENIMAAISAVKVYNVDNKSICSVLESFGGVEHRIEYVTTIDGIDFYNDSKATNCESTKIALKSFNQPTLLILGGLDRGHSFEELTPCMNNVTYVACYGETKARIKEYCDKNGIDCGVFDNLVNATTACYEKAVKGDVVLLSPACASWDQYKKFEDRGDEFKNTIKNFKGE
jgi:UDP-N-acetylmuramoylalanine--D-glutamate ligase